MENIKSAKENKERKAGLIIKVLLAKIFNLKKVEVCNVITEKYFSLE